MSNKKRMLALGLAATLTLGSSMTAFAGDNEGSTIGAGTSEGHVDKTVTQVILPTVAENATPFAYTMDPEGLIGETGGAKYADTTFPDADADTGVYFLTGEKTYGNASQELTVINQSSHSIDLTVKAEVDTPAATDIGLVAKDALATSEDAALYLGLVVGTEDAVAVSKDAAATKTVSLAGKPDNFKIAVNEAGDGYVYRALTPEEYKAIDGNADKEIEWESTTFKMEGATTTDKLIDASTTAPTLKVTWSWVDPAATPAEPGFTADNYAYTAGSELVANVTLPEGASGIEVVAFKTSSSSQWSPFTEGTDYTYTDGKITFPADSGKLYTVAGTLTEDLTVTLGFKPNAGTTIYEATLVVKK